MALKFFPLLAHAAAALALLLLPASLIAQSPARPTQVHFIWMGGDDCPPCVAWRAQELPVLQKTKVFREIAFSYVPKNIRSAVPPRFYLPEAVKPFKEKLDAANAGRIGSPQVALLVNGKVFDYFFGARSALDIEEMLIAARNGGRYPFPRCLRLEANGPGCAGGWIPAPAR